MAGMPEEVQKNRNELVHQIIEDIQAGKPFFWDSGHESGLPMNPTSKNNRYHNGNIVRLMYFAKKHGFTDNRWMTFEQAKAKGYRIPYGTHGAKIEWWGKQYNKYEINPDTGKKEKKVVRLDHPIVKIYTVFNAEQIVGIEAAKPTLCDPEAKNKYMENMLQNSEAPIFYDSLDKNCYQPANDEIHVMAREKFKTLDAFYATCAHEIAHSTGSEERLNRKIENSFGTPDYAREELRAEMASMFLHQEYGIEFDQSHYKNHSAYMQSWAEALQKNPNELYRAAADADQIAMYMNENMIQKGLQKGEESEAGISDKEPVKIVAERRPEPFKVPFQAEEKPEAQPEKAEVKKEGKTTKAAKAKTRTKRSLAVKTEKSQSKSQERALAR